MPLLVAQGSNGIVQHEPLAELLKEWIAAVDLGNTRIECMDSTSTDCE